MSELAAFPSLVVRAQGFVPSGAFAEAQAAYLDPDPAEVAELGRLLAAHEAGIVAHYYMDPELQGVLSACPWPHIHISDSLVMADRAVKMVEAGARRIVVLGVDFMSENVRAMLDAAGHAAVPVWRVAERPIGCSLAEAAESPSYAAYLERAAGTPRSLHVVYINTSLRTKAQAHARVPTITCTSSNVVQTVLQAFAQIPDATVWFGPDTYMGENLQSLFAHLGELDDAAIRRVHPAHDRASLARLRARFHHFEQGSCVVHHLFGASVVETVKRSYADCFVTAHLEVPGEMFALALAAAARDAGVVGSTSNILDFIGRKVDERAKGGGGGRLRFVLGTEAGMITAIVRRVQATLRAAAERTPDTLEVEIVFPVAAEAVLATGERELPIVPGVAGGEGCSPAGGCATCPYMKMNSLEALFDVLGRLDRPATLAAFAPRVYRELVAGRSAAELGSEPILHMRAFQHDGVLPDALVRDVVARRAPG
ncbi:MAG: quinolinate synthase NadA [Polyangiaceae bacterium]|nr:quinolinate synthase NadA [Polyangiaceae bacterium]